MHLKKIIALSLAVTALLSLAACKNNGDDLNIKTGSYLAGGTIPANAKIYPIINEDLTMTVIDENEELTAEDIWEITNHVDVWTTWNDTRGDGVQLDKVKEFASMDRIEMLQTQANESDRDYSVDAVQILYMEVENDGRVQVVYVMKFTGECPSEGLGEETYESVEGLYFKKINNKWYEDGIGALILAKSGTLIYTKDDMTGKYSVEPTEKYYT